MFTNNLRLAFYVVVGIQYAIIIIASYWEMKGAPASVSSTLANLGNWYYVLLTGWQVVFLWVVSAIIKSREFPKYEGTAVLFGGMLLAVVLARMS